MTTSNKIYLIIFGIMCWNIGNAQGTPKMECKKSESFLTTNGEISKTTCTDQKGIQIKDVLSIDNTPILSDKMLVLQDHNNDRTISIYESGDYNNDASCPSKIYLVDNSKKPVKVIAFGVKKGCNYYREAKWEKNRSTITLKKNAIFIYENGRITLPTPGERLWEAIAAPESGEGLSTEDAIGFAKFIPPPKEALINPPFRSALPTFAAEQRHLQILAYLRADTGCF